MPLVNVFKSLFTSTHTIPTRLWRAGGLVAAFLLTILIGNSLLSKERAVTWDMLGHDFLPFYYGGTCALTGHYEQLYDLPATREFEFKVGAEAGLALGTSFGPWWNPPFAAWMFAPFARLPYLEALHAWWTISAVAFVASMFLLCNMLSGGWKTKLLVPFLALMAMPCVQAFCHGQNTYVSLLLLTITVWLWRKNQPLSAGIICGLLFYKPQLGATIAAVLCFHQGRRAILGVCVTAATLAVINILTLPGTLHEFVYHMPLNLHWIQEQNLYRWERHVTLKAFWRLVFQRDSIGPMVPVARDCWLICEVALASALGFLAFKSLRDRSATQRDRLISAAIAAMPLLMPFYFDYDLMLLTVALVVYAAERQRNGETFWEDSALMGVWAATFLTLMFFKTILNPLVPLLAAAAVLLIRRGVRPAPKGIAINSAGESRGALPTALAA
jgi:hypothetical protein